MYVPYITLHYIDHTRLKSYRAIIVLIDIYVIVRISNYGMLRSELRVNMMILIDYLSKLFLLFYTFKTISARLECVVFRIVRPRPSSVGESNESGIKQLSHGQQGDTVHVIP